MATNPTRSPVVLLVEEERSPTDPYEPWLADEYETRTSYGDEQILELVDEDVDLVVLDRRMSDPPSDEVLNRIQNRESVYCVAVTSTSDPEFDEIDPGFDDHIGKPVSRDELRDTIRHLARRATYSREVREYYELVSKKAALEAERSAGELEENDEYTALEAEIADLDDQLESQFIEFEQADIAALFRELDERDGLEIHSGGSDDHV